ncbi:MAG: hypothetical protein Q8O59_01760 [bacterium]|nr:hypothetical protein [bacterium]
MQRKIKYFSPPIINTHLNILFHHYRHHKESLTALRVWSVGKLLSPKQSGWVNLNELLKTTNIAKRYFIESIYPNTNFFRGYNGKNIYLTSYSKVKEIHHLKDGLIRKEKMSKRFIWQFRSKAKFEGYILKCYVEKDLRRKLKRITWGRISYEMVANNFKITRRTAISLLKNSTARPLKNIRNFPNIRFKKKKELRNWLLKNMDKRIDGYLVGDNPNSYRLHETTKDYYLTQRLPNMYRFTGVCLTGRKGATKKFNYRPLKIA